MSAPEIAPAQDTKTCEVCTEKFGRRRARESRAQFAARRFCGRVCMGAARRKTSAKPRKTADLLPAAAPARVVNGTWRPSAPGWPDQPVIPAHLRRAAK